MSSLDLLRDFAVSASVVALVALVAAALLRHNPANRSWVLTAGFGLLLLSPTLPLLSQQLSLGAMKPRTSISPTSTFQAPTPLPQQTRGQGGQVAEQRFGAPLPTPPPVPKPIPANTPFPWLTLVWSLWLGGAVLSLGMLLRGSIVAKRIVSAATPEQNPYILDLYSRCLQEMDLPEGPRLLRSISVPVPVAFGGGKPAVVLPAQMPELEPEALRGVLLHELAHLRYRHHRLALLQGVAVSFHWWNPLPRLMDRLLGNTCEELCDVWAISSVGKRKAYAEALLKFSEMASKSSRFQLGSAFVGSGSDLAKRIERVLSGSSPTAKFATRTGIALGSIAVTGGAAIAMLARPGDGSVAGEKIWPMLDGAEWTYSQTYVSGKETRQTSLKRIVWAQTTDGRNPVIEMREISGTDATFIYWSVTEDGIYAYKSGTRGLERGLSPASRWPLLKLPAKPGDTWTWNSASGYQTSGDAIRPMEDEIRIVHTATVENTNDPVGKYSAIKVVEKADGRMSGPSTVTTWFAEGVGIVKQIRVDRSGEWTTTLVDNSPGEAFSDPAPVAWQFAGFEKAALAKHQSAFAEREALDKEVSALKKQNRSGSPEGKAAIQKLRVAEQRLRESSPIKEVVHGTLVNGFRSRFYYVPARKEIVRVYQGTASAFDPLSEADWNVLLDQETQWTSDRGLDLGYLGPAASVLATYRLGMTSKEYLVMGGQQSKQVGDKVQSVAVTRGFISPNKMWLVDLTMLVHGSEIESIDYDIHR